MEEKRFCRYCGEKISVGAKFCRNCGKRLIKTESQNEVKEEIPLESSPKENIKKPLQKKSASSSSFNKEDLASKQKEFNEKLEKGKEQASKIAKNVDSKVKLAGKNAKRQAEQYKKQYEEKDEVSKNKIKKILLAIAIVLIAVTGTWWYQGKDYRQAMKSGETYFERGEYGEAQYYFKEAHNEKPGNEEALTMLDHADYLGSVWTNINEGWGDKVISDACDEIEHKMSDIKDKDIKLKYDEALTRIVNSSDYEMEQRIRGRLEAAYK
ncbi:zinc ribbon domain-containing protein [Enterococcus dispar]|uniref:zinc ribbon domain-containing protein n=1 Tax=Enterococcus dispar TaxID=44009 RepID=UPI0024906562|nr:zinc ribbon domain-containing protein [Enterococcus dispar]